MTRHRYDTKQPHAFATLISVLAILALSSIIIVGVILANNDTLQSDNRAQLSVQAKALANTCGEIAVNKLKISTAYTGSETFPIGNGTCQILAISGSGNTNRVIQTVGTVSTVIRKVEISIATVNPNTVLNYWTDKPF